MSCRLRVPSGARNGGAGVLDVSVVSAGPMSPRKVAGMAAGVARTVGTAGNGTALGGLGSLGRLSGRSSCGLSSAAAGRCREGVFFIGSAWRTRRTNDGHNESNETSDRNNRNDNDAGAYKPVVAPGDSVAKRSAG